MKQTHSAETAHPADEGTRRFARRALFVLLSLLLAFGTMAPVLADDTDLLRANGANPFLFIILDNSRSMSATLDDEWTHAGADDPRSKIYMAKEALYEVLGSLDTINYGLATFNQDELRVTGKHYLYFVRDTEDNQNALDLLPSNLGTTALDYPAIEPSNVVESAAGVSIEGDLMTFGRTYEANNSSSVNVIDRVVPAGECDAPLSLATEREKINRYPRLGENGTETIEMFVEGQANTTYRLHWRRPALATWSMGDDTVEVELGVAEITDCSASDVQNSVLPDDVTIQLELGLWKEFLFIDDGVGLDTTATGTGGGGGCGAENAQEISGGFWDDVGRDVASNQDDVDTSTCGDKPFSGQGWEGNYDTGRPFAPGPSPEPNSGVFDTFCDGTPLTDANCENIKFVTDLANSPNAREIDVGDVLPWHWETNHHDELLTRLNPNHDTALAPDFGVSQYFEDSANSLGVLPLKSGYENSPPILAYGDSPVGAAVLDFRCWFTGTDGNKCPDSTEYDSPYTSTGFFGLLQQEDPSLTACRRPFLIVITDLYHNCTANSDVATIANMAAQTKDSGVDNGIKTWLLNMGDLKCNGFTKAGSGEEIDIESGDQLRSVLVEIIGEIEETRRAFAAAAVPTVQADSEDKIYFTQFTPLQDQAIWPSEVLAFTKPLPTIEEAVQDNPSTPEDESLTPRQVPDSSKAVFDAGIEILAQAPDFGSLPNDFHSLSELQLGGLATQRRVVYMVDDGEEPPTRALFGPQPQNIFPQSSTFTENDIREDLWSLLGIANVDLGARTLTQIKADFPDEIEEAHRIFKYTYEEKQWFDEDGNLLRTYVLGDIFHSNPQVLSDPSNPFFLSDPELFPEYERFSERHERRRKMLIVGANDGMVHFFDVGRWEGDFNGEYNNGSGREVLAYIPRQLMPKLKQIEDDKDLPDPSHRWFVDGTPQLADVLIDVDKDSSTGVKTEDGDQTAREWRTVVIGGLRRGGRAIYALDVTQPDPVQEEFVSVQGVSVSQGFLPTNNSVVPNCWNTESTAADGLCDVVPFGTPLWEFTDENDEDGGGDDLANTWSAPEIGAILVERPGEEPEPIWVAIFGGGLSPDGPSDSGVGNWLYMVDIETGEAIYKRQLGDGSAAAPPASVDINQDGLLDRVYIPTTEGLLFRVDMTTVPSLERNTSECTSPVFDDFTCLVDDDLDGDSILDWDPVVFFDTVSEEDIPQGDGTTVRGDVRKQIFFAPSVFFVGQLGSYGLAFGTGNRDELWTAGPPGGNRFYVMVDETCANSGIGSSTCLDPTVLPLDQTDLVDVTTEDPDRSAALLDLDVGPGERGWFFKLGVDETGITPSDFFRAQDERVVTAPTTISGLSVFSTFVPDTQREVVSGDPLCSRRGLSRAYIAQTASGASIPGRSRFKTVADLVSEPFLDRFQTQNDPSADPADDPCEGNAALFEELKNTIFPDSCQFSPNIRFNLMTNRADTGVECIVQIPVCIQQRNWKEF